MHLAWASRTVRDFFYQALALLQDTVLPVPTSWRQRSKPSRPVPPLGQPICDVVCPVSPTPGREVPVLLVPLHDLTTSAGFRRVCFFMEMVSFDVYPFRFHPRREIQ